jgi:hypothetical protein
MQATSVSKVVSLALSINLPNFSETHNYSQILKYPAENSIIFRRNWSRLLISVFVRISEDKERMMTQRSLA